VSDRLAVVEEPERFVVVWEDDPGDWLCVFAKREGFPAERWAQDMARTYNARSELSRTSSRRPPGASGR
jgi:hypothetical protein